MMELSGDEPALLEESSESEKLELDLEDTTQPTPPPVVHAKRSDIQCLRALAVILVVLFHLELPYMMGGFIGVDIFFVISGYLVGGRIIRDKIADSFSFPEFIGRRLHRLFIPSFTCLGLVVIMLASLSLQFHWDIAFAGIYGANFWFYFDTKESYFQPNTESSFVLHFWSLAVEEQIYVFMPLVFYLYFWGRHSLLSSTIFVVPLTIASFLTIFFIPDGAKFYLPSSRLWEFLIGTMVSMCEQPLRQYLSSVQIPYPKYTRYLLEAFRWACMVSLVICGVFYKSDSWPNYLAIFPVIATALIILIDSPIPLAAFERIGDFSYAIYLFHWPLIRFGSLLFLKLDNDLPLIVTYFLFLLLTAIFAVGCYYLVEKPTMAHLHCRPWIWILVSAIITIAFFCICLIPILVVGAGPTPIPPPSNATNLSVPFVHGCDIQTGTAIRKAMTFCRVSTARGPLTDKDYGYKPKMNNTDLCILGIGDSHTRHWSPTIQAVAAELGVPRERIYWFILNLERNRVLEEENFTAASPLLARALPKEIWACKEKMVMFGMYSQWSTIYHKADLIINQTKALIDRYSKLGCTVFFGDGPSWNMLTKDVPNAYTPCSCLKYTGNPRNASTCTFRKDQVVSNYKGKSFSAHQADIFKDHPDVRVMMMEDQLCENNVCPTIYNGAPIYFDADHFSELFGIAMARHARDLILQSGCPQRILNATKARLNVTQ